MRKITIWVASAAFPDPHPSPSIPSVFTSEAEAEAYMQTTMRQEWEANGPEEEPYPGCWVEAQERILAEHEGEPTWGCYELTAHSIHVPVPDYILGLVQAAQDVVANWSEGDLAGAVNALEEAANDVSTILNIREEA